MLEVALSLEQRYRTLLPPDRRWMEKKLDKSPRKRNSIDVMEIGDLVPFKFAVCLGHHELQ